MSRWLQANYKRKAVDVGYDIQKNVMDKLRSDNDNSAIVENIKQDQFSDMTELIFNVIKSEYSDEYNELKSSIENDVDNLKEQFESLSEKIASNKKLIVDLSIRYNVNENTVYKALSNLERQLSAQQESQKAISELLDMIKQKAENSETNSVIAIIMIALLCLVLGVGYKVNKVNKQIDEENKQFKNKKKQEIKQHDKEHTKEEIKGKEQRKELIRNVVWTADGAAEALYYILIKRKVPSDFKMKNISLTEEDIQTLWDFAFESEFGAFLLLDYKLIDPNKQPNKFRKALNFILAGTDDWSSKYCYWLLKHKIVTEENSSDYRRVLLHALKNKELITDMFYDNLISEDLIDKYYPQQYGTKAWDKFINDDSNFATLYDLGLKDKK